jgi:hypothetical protein
VARVGLQVPEAKPVALMRERVAWTMDRGRAPLLAAGTTARSVTSGTLCQGHQGGPGPHILRGQTNWDGRDLCDAGHPLSAVRSVTYEAIEGGPERIAKISARRVPLDQSRPPSAPSKLHPPAPEARLPPVRHCATKDSEGGPRSSGFSPLFPGRCQVSGLRLAERNGSFAPTKKPRGPMVA